MSKGRKVPPPPITSPDLPGIMNLEAIWIAAGKPKGKEPINWIKSEGRAVIKRSLAQGHMVISNDPEVLSILQEIENELRAERTSAA